MATQDFMGKGQLLERLTAQVGDRKLAISILQKRGHLKEDGKTYTEAGLVRNVMTAEDRAIDRASKKTGLSPENLKYNSKTNTIKKLK